MVSAADTINAFANHVGVIADFLELLPLAIVCALSPWAIVAVILMLASDRPPNSVMWLVGWTLSTMAIGVVVVLFLGGHDFSSNSTPTTVACVIQVLLGVLLESPSNMPSSRSAATQGPLPPPRPHCVEFPQ